MTLDLGYRDAMRCVVWLGIATACSNPPRVEPVRPPPLVVRDASPDAPADPLAGPLPVELPLVAADRAVVFTAKEFIVVPVLGDIHASRGTLGVTPIGAGLPLEQPTQPGPWPKYALALDDAGPVDAIVLADRFASWTHVTGQLSYAWLIRGGVAVATPAGVQRARYVLRPPLDRDRVVRLVADSVSVRVVGQDEDDREALVEVPWAEVPARLAALVPAQVPVDLAVDRDARVEQIVSLLATLEQAGVREVNLGEPYGRYDEKYDWAKFEIAVAPEQGGATRRIQSAIVARREQLSRCYLRRARRAPGVSGNIALEVTVPPAGRLAAVTMAKGDPELAACFQRVVASIDFLPPRANVAITATATIKVRSGLMPLPSSGWSPRDPNLTERSGGER